MSTVDPTIAARAGTLTATGQDSAVRTIGRGLEIAPVLRQGLGVTWLLAAVGAGGRVVVPILLQQAIDNGIVDGEVRIDYVVQLSIVALVAVTVSAFGFRQASYRLGVRSEQALYDLRVQLIDHIGRLSLADHNEERRGGLVARVTSDIETLSRFFQWGGLAWLLDGTLMFIVGGVMLAYNWVLALVAFAVALPLAFVLRLVQSHLVAAYDLSRERNGEMLGAIAEVVSGVDTIRAYDAGEKLRGDVRDSVERKTAAQIKAALLGAILFPSGEVFSVFTISAVIGVGVWLGPASGLTAGALVGFVFLTYRFLEPIAEFVEVLDQTQSAVAGLRRVLSVLDMPIGPPAASDPVPLPAGNLAIDVRDVSFSYRSRDRAGSEDFVLKHVDLCIPPGQNVALVGATGSGKTTLGRLIARFADPTIGEIDLGGVPLTCVDNSELRRRLTVVSQEPFLFDDSVAANVAFARNGASVADVERVVDDLHVRDWVEGLADGLGTRVGERGERLSAGERQLVALLRAGIADPDVLILDEATSSVDALTEVRIGRALHALAASRTTIAIAHRLSTAARADRVIVLDSGVVAEDGRHDDLLAAGGVYERLYEAWISATTITPNGSPRGSRLDLDAEREGAVDAPDEAVDLVE